MDKAINTNRQDRINELRTLIKWLQDRISEFHRELKVLKLERDKERYCCSCVRLNHDLGISTIGEEEKAQRRGLGCGYVSDTLSAEKYCPICQGKGIPQ